MSTLFPSAGEFDQRREMRLRSVTESPDPPINFTFLSHYDRYFVLQCNSRIQMIFIRTSSIPPQKMEVEEEEIILHSHEQQEHGMQETQQQEDPLTNNTTRMRIV